MIILTFLLLIASAGSLYARPGDASFVFLNIPMGVRGTGMGNAYTAVAEDASATWWNPAALAFIQRTEVGYAIWTLLPGISNYDPYVVQGHEIHYIPGFATVGFNVMHLDLGEYERRDSYNRYLGLDRAFEREFTIACGIFPLEKREDLAVGFSYKYIYRHFSSRGAGQEKGTGIAKSTAIDIAAIYKLHLSYPFRLQFGMNLANLGPKVKYDDATQAKPIPTTLRIGAAFIAEDKEDLFRFTLTSEIEKGLIARHSDGSSDPFYKALITSWSNNGGFLSRDERSEFIWHFGAEIWILNMLALRGGTFNDPLGQVNSQSLGLSLQFVVLRLDYSHQFSDSPIGGEDRFQFSLYFDHIRKFTPGLWWNRLRHHIL